MVVNPITDAQQAQVRAALAKAGVCEHVGPDGFCTVSQCPTCQADIEHYAREWLAAYEARVADPEAGFVVSAAGYEARIAELEEGLREIGDHPCEWSDRLARQARALLSPPTPPEGGLK